MDIDLNMLPIDVKLRIFLQLKHIMSSYYNQGIQSHIDNDKLLKKSVDLKLTKTSAKKLLVKYALKKPYDVDMFNSIVKFKELESQLSSCSRLVIIIARKLKTGQTLDNREHLILYDIITTHRLNLK